MPGSKYKKKYAEELVEYFKRFIELRDDPAREMTKKPCSGYPSLVKFAIKIGVTPQTLNNWRDKHDEFREAMEFADLIQDEVLNERALMGTVDGRVAMKIRELKAASRKEAVSEGGGTRLMINIGDDGSGDRIEVKTWTGEVNEDTEY